MDNEKALKHIRNAYVLAILSGVITLLLIISSILKVWNSGLDVSELVDVVLIFGLAFGISKKSRICAIILFIYYILNKIFMILSVNYGSLAIMVIFIIGYFKGIRGTIHYHKNLKLEKMNNETLNENLSL